MVKYNSNMLDEYLKDDWILDLIKNNMENEETEIRTNKWLLEMDNKRMIFADVYSDLLKPDGKSPKSVLDIGGGVTTLTKLLSKNTNYTLCDFIAHGGEEYLRQKMEEYSINWINSDWYDVDFEEYDIVVANDIFPDVDQRLELFIDKMLPCCKELRLVLTYYNEPRFYQMGRSDDSEILTFLSWDGDILGMKLKKYANRSDMSFDELDNMKNDVESIYWNKRQVCYARLKGDLSN